jgi:hypothetical protein
VTISPVVKCEPGKVLVKWWPITTSSGVTDSSSTVCATSHPAGAGGGIADAAEVAAYVVARPLQRGRHEGGVLEAVATAAAGHELLLHRRQRDAAVLPQQDVDVVEGEGAHVCLVKLGEGLPGRRSRRHAEPGEVALDVQLGDLPDVRRHAPIEAHAVLASHGPGPR